MSGAQRRVRQLERKYDWACIWCESFFTDEEVIDDHDHGFDEPLCPQCSDRPDLADVSTYLVNEVLP